MKQLLLFALGLTASLAARAQVGIGTPTPDPKAILELKAPDKGLLIPRMLASQRTVLTGVPQGLLVYQTDAPEGFYYYGGSPAAWVYLNPSAGSGFTLPYSGTASTGGTAFAVANTGLGAAVQGTTTNGSAGVYGSSKTGSGVYGTATSSPGYGVQGTTTAANTAGVYGNATGTTTYGVIGNGETGVYGSGTSGPGVYGRGSGSGLALLAEKPGSSTGRVADLTNAGSDSTAVYVNTSGMRPALRAVNTNASAQAALRGVKTAGTDGIGLEGVVTSGGGNAAGVLGNDRTGTSGGSGIIGLTAGGYGVRGIASANGGYGVSGSATDSYGVVGGSSSGIGVYGSSVGGYGVSGSSTNTSGVYGSTGTNVGTLAGVQGVSGSGSSSVGVLGTTGGGYGVRGVATASGGYGVQGVATNSYAIIGTSTSGVGVQGNSTSSQGVFGSSNSSYGVQGTSNSSYGVYGSTAAANTGTAAGVWGDATSNGGVGVLGRTSSGNGVRGEATGSSGFGVSGTASGSGGYAFIGSATGAANGLYATTSGTGRTAYFNQTGSSNTANALEVQNASLGRTAFFNQNNTSSTVDAMQVHNAGTGTSLLLSGGLSSGFSVTGGTIDFSSSATATPYATINGFAAAYVGPSLAISVLDGTSQTTRLTLNSLGAAIYTNTSVQGNLSVTGTLSKGGGSFKIDHPLDPENQYLYHSFVESPDMLNVYNGNVTLDASGEATVALPDYFEALNRDFRYQLTPIGAPFTPYVKEEVSGNKFRIAGQSGGKVSWQVTGIRQDKWANQNRIPNAAPKEAENRGKYLHPTAYGQPAERGIGYRPASLPHPASAQAGQQAAPAPASR